MPTATLGLSTYQWNNNIKSLLLLAALPALLVGLVWLFFWGVGTAVMMDTPQAAAFLPAGFVRSFGLDSATSMTPEAFANEGVMAYGLYALGIAAIWILIGGFFSENFISLSTGSRQVERAAHPELYNLLENLCISRGLPMPKLYIINTPVTNAFASGLSRGSFSITVTNGLLEKLDKDELEAVLAHELSHIINRDVRLLVVTVLFAGMLSFLAEMMWRSMRHSSYSGRRNKGSGLIIIIAAVLLSVGYFVSLLLRFALSRRREYLADAGSVELTKRPDALISALRKISRNAAMPSAPSGVQAMMIENPPSLFDLFDTHPPIEERIEVLRRLGGVPDEGESIIPRTRR